MLVEFFGLPGAGKSTVSRGVAVILAEWGLALDEITYDLDHGRRGPGRLLTKLAYLARYAAANPGRAVSYLAGIVATRQARSADLGKSIFNWLFVVSLAARHRSLASITFLDQGIAQALWSIGFAARNEAWLDVLLAGRRAEGLRPDLIVNVQAGFGAIERRLAARARRISRLEDDIGDESDAPLLRAEAKAEAILDRFRAAGVPVIDVANDDPGQLAAAAELIAHRVMAMLGEQPLAAVPSRARPAAFVAHEMHR